MEAKKQTKKQTKVVSEKTYLKLKRSNEKYKATIIVLSVVMVIMIMVLLLLYYSEKNGPILINNDCSNRSDVFDNKDTSESSKISITTDNQLISFGSVSHNLRAIDDNYNVNKISSTLFLNDNAVATLGYGDLDASVVDKYLFIEWPGAQGGALALGYFDETGFYYPLNESEIYYYNVYSDNGKIYASVESFETGEYDTEVVEIEIKGNEVSVVDYD